MAGKKGAPVVKTMWAYGYQIKPPQPEHRLREIRVLLDSEHSEAKRNARTWEGRFVTEQDITHILVVSDSPDQNREVNRRLEAALTELQAGFMITAPLAVADDTGPPPEKTEPGT
ncbi:MAG: hypothetical protein ACHQXA_02025 [Gemmatimonadales bacterium]